MKKAIAIGLGILIAGLVIWGLISAFSAPNPLVTSAQTQPTETLAPADAQVQPDAGNSDPAVVEATQTPVIVYVNVTSTPEPATETLIPTDTAVPTATIEWVDDSTNTPTPGAQATADGGGNSNGTEVFNWQGAYLTREEINFRLGKAGWFNPWDMVSEAVEDGTHVSILTVGATAPAQAIAEQFPGAVTWFVYGKTGGGKECGYRTPQTGRNDLLRIQFYSTGQYLPETTSCRLAP